MSLLPIFATLEPLERVGSFTPLGIRFWDPAVEAAVTDGLEVTIRPPDRPDLSRGAFHTLSGVYAFRDLPGLRSLEALDPRDPAGVHPEESSPPVRYRFIVNVRDRLGRFLPVTFKVDLPYRGIYPTRRADDSPPQPGLPGFFLFSSPSRSVLSGLAVVRAQLIERLGPGQFRPARHAVLALQTAPNLVWYGIADETGSAAVYFPYPPFNTLVGPASPPGPAETRLQSWDTTIHVQYRPSAQSKPDTAAAIPDLGAILTQPAASLWLSPGGPVQAEWSTRLIFGQPLMLQTAGRSELWIEP